MVKYTSIVLIVSRELFEDGAHLLVEIVFQDQRVIPPLWHSGRVAARNEAACRQKGQRSRPHRTAPHWRECF